MTGEEIFEVAQRAAALIERDTPEAAAEAKALFLALHEDDPAEAYFLTGLAMAQNSLGEHAEAERCVDRAVAADPAGAGAAYALRAELRLRRGDRVGARADLERNLELLPPESEGSDAARARLFTLLSLASPPR